MSKVDKIIIEGFKSIKKVELPLMRLNVLVGANGAGKSNFVSVFRLLNKIVDQDLQSYVVSAGGANKLLHFGQKQTSIIRIRINFSPNAYECNLIPTSDDRLLFASETGFFTGDYVANRPVLLASTGQPETGLHRSTAQIATYVRRYMSDWKVYHFHDTSDQAEVKKTCRVADSTFLRPNASNLAARLFFLKRFQQSSFDKILHTVQLIAPFLQDFILEPSGENREYIRLQWKHRGTDAYFDASDLSDGTLRFICLATLLLQPSLPSVILLDEPELGLHPHAISLLVDLFRTASVRAQIVASTQSVTLINQLAPEDVIAVDRDGDVSVFNRLTPSQLKPWLEEYALGDVWEKNVFGAAPQ